MIRTFLAMMALAMMALAMMALVAVLLAPPLAAAERVVRVKGPERVGDVRDDYFRDALALALDRTAAADGPWRIEVGLGANQTRSMSLLLAGDVDVIWAVPTAEREAEALPVRFPLEKGLLGYRVMVIRKDAAAQFAAVRTLEDLKALTAGQGHDWISSRVLRANGLPVATENNIDSLYAALKAGRFDHLPRGVNEAWAELEARQDDALMVEPDLLVVYPTTSYFFLRPDDAALAARIERGLRAALADGGFDRLLLEHPNHAAMFRKAGLERRRIFRIDNPFMPDSAPPLDGPEWAMPIQASVRR